LQENQHTRAIIERVTNFRRFAIGTSHHMTIFRLKQLVHGIHGAPKGMHWTYDRAELWADGAVHIVGVCCGLIAAVVLIVFASLYLSPSHVAAVAVYAAGLLAMLAISAIYNILPVSHWKWWMRRLDHSAIYWLIAATYTPFIMQMNGSRTAIALLAGVWSVAITGTLLKIFVPGRFDRLSVVLYLAMGWSGVMIYDTMVSSLSAVTLTLIAVGGALYSLGVIFHSWQRLRFQNAIWHSFVLLGAACHYTAVLDLVLT
jgi:hemolysin III